MTKMNPISILCRQTKRNGLAIVLAICAALAAPLALQAQGAESNLHFHGFGDWVYGKTNGNLFGDADSQGRYDDAAFGLNIRYDTSDQIAVISQVAFEHAEGLNADTETVLDYAFVQWTKNERLHLRIGRTYHPFGIYTEIRDIGTARPFIERPPEIYEALGIISSSLSGIAAYGTIPTKGKWGLHYDVYAGATELPIIEPGSSSIDETVESIHDVVGARLSADTPIDGLRGAVGMFAGKEKGSGERHRSTILSLEYMNSHWLLRAEGADHHESAKTTKGAYLEGGYRTSGAWQFTGRVGSVRITRDGNIESRFLHHRDVGGGINYWLDPNVVIKTELHFIDGNRLALSLPLSDSKAKTRVIQAGVQFAF